MPLKDIDIEASVTGFVSNVQCQLEYENEEQVPIEAKFVFPVDDQSAVYKFEAVVDGRLIVAECQEKDQVGTSWPQCQLGMWKIRNECVNGIHVHDAQKKQLLWPLLYQYDTFCTKQYFSAYVKCEGKGVVIQNIQTSPIR